MKYIEESLGLEVDLIKDPDTDEYVQFEWRDILGYESLYQVSNYGQVKSLDKYVRHSRGGLRFVRGRLLLQRIKRKYYTVVLSKKGLSITKSVHRLVAESFHPNKEAKPQVNHKNGTQTDNHSFNLEWNTFQENLNHAKENNLIPRGEKVHNSTLSNLEVIEICELLDYNEYSQKEIADFYNVKPHVITDIHTGKSRNWLTNRKGNVDISKGRKSRVKVVNCRGEVFKSIEEASNKSGIYASGISASCNGIQKTAGKYEDGTRIKWNYC